MSNTFKITEDLFWVGALDPNLRIFDIIMETKFGTSYNSYLLKGSDGIALFETVKEKFFDEKGITYYQPTDEELNQWKEYAASLSDKWRELIGEELYNQVSELFNY